MDAITTLLYNLNGGIRLALLMPMGRIHFRPSADQAVLLILLGLGLDIGYEYIAVEPERVFNAYGLSYAGCLYLLFIFSAFLIARVQRSPYTASSFLVLVASTTPIMLLARLLCDGLQSLELIGSERLHEWAIFFCLLVWLLVIASRALKLIYDTRPLQTGKLVFVYGLCNIAPLFMLPAQTFWHTDWKNDSGYIAEKKEPINVEDTFYSQGDLLRTATDGLKRDRGGVTDLYYVGFGGDASQDVFMKEVFSVQRIFDTRFDTRGRSVTLINNRDTVTSHPLANSHNLEYVLTEVARRMDLEEDILFLFLTSHGSKKHELSVSFGPLGLNDIPTPRLREILEGSGIKWRVIVVSACYSGGFLEPLQNQYSLIMTASRHDRNSFGCSHENEFTYFGKAYFDQQLRTEYSFVDAFKKAKEEIKQRELREDRTPSLPQIHIGSDIEAKLDDLHTRLTNGPRNSAPSLVLRR